MEINKRFTFEIPVLKAYEKEVSEKGKKVTKRFVEGKASSTDVDLHGDRMAESAIESMAESIKKHKILLNAEHDKSWQSELGEITEMTISESFELLMRAELDETSKAKDLWHAIVEKGKKLGLSIGGYVKEYKIDVNQETGDWIRTFTEIELDHIAVVSSPANPKTWVGAISKSIGSFETNKEIDNRSKGKLSEEEIKALVELAEAIKDKDKFNLIKKEDMKKAPLETDVKKDIDIADVSGEKESVTPENGGSEEITDAPKEEVSEEETPTEESAVGDEKTVDEEQVKEEEVVAPEEEAVTPIEENVETPAEEEVEAPVEEKGEEETTEVKETPADEEKEEEVEEEVVSKRLEVLEKSLNELNNYIKGDNELTKALSTITDAVKEVSMSVETLVKRVDTLENQPSARKTSEAGKSLGGGSNVSEPKLSLDEALKKAEDENRHMPNLFAIKQRIRAEYREKYGIGA